ncbi:hypothetical protein scyTo_0007235 [Scyliorhinus torazame]|uniref:Uncharacterized protein n=1 Tax=Scyliorhinus torazame TaxID=75743 RepID=A0A401NNF8_SCYTO|nr:hypothetical protein [Scyliorhinus torazame]
MGCSQILTYSRQILKDTETDKERELIGKVQAAEEDFQKLTAVQNEKLELENKVAELERLKTEQEIMWHAEKEQMEEKLQLPQFRSGEGVQFLIIGMAPEPLRYEEMSRDPRGDFTQEAYTG